MLLDFIKGIALLLSLCLLQGFSVRLFGRHKQLEQLVSGLLFGGICVIGMMTPVQLAPGVIFDARTVILSMAGLFGGTTVALIAGTILALTGFGLAVMAVSSVLQPLSPASSSGLLTGMQIKKTW